LGRRGKSPIPTALKVLHGERRSERLNTAAPVPNGAPTMPRGMSRRAQSVWRRQIKALAGTGILTAADGDCLRVYCESVDRYIVASQMLAVDGPLIVGQKGNDVRNPLTQIVRDNAALVRTFGRDLGFSPGSREGLHVVADDDADPLAVWLADDEP
jgi:P27 family predicted phage terminase small subunit